MGDYQLFPSNGRCNPCPYYVDISSKFAPGQKCKLGVFYHWANFYGMTLDHIEGTEPGYPCKRFKEEMRGILKEE